MDSTAIIICVVLGLHILGKYKTILPTNAPFITT